MRRMVWTLVLTSLAKSALKGAAAVALLAALVVIIVKPTMISDFMDSHLASSAQEVKYVTMPQPLTFAASRVQTDIYQPAEFTDMVQVLTTGRLRMNGLEVPGEAEVGAIVLYEPGATAKVEDLFPGSSWAATFNSIVTADNALKWALQQMQRGYNCADRTGCNEVRVVRVSKESVTLTIYRKGKMVEGPKLIQ